MSHSFLPDNRLSERVTAVEFHAQNIYLTVYKGDGGLPFLETLVCSYYPTIRYEYSTTRLVHKLLTTFEEVRMNSGTQTGENTNTNARAGSQTDLIEAHLQQFRKERLHREEQVASVVNPNELRFAKDNRLEEAAEKMLKPVEPKSAPMNCPSQKRRDADKSAKAKI